MIITDEMLSAFLDAALPEAQMQQIRQQIMQDDQLTERLADLAMVDSLVQQYYAQIDARALPAAVLQWLDEPAERKAAEKKTADIIAFPRWQKVQQQLQRHAAAIACIAVFAGYGLTQLVPQQDTVALNNAVLQQLDHVPSGRETSIAGQQLSLRLSFINQQGDFCRQFAVQHDNTRAEHVACRQQGEWTVMASLVTPNPGSEGQYQTASGANALDDILDTLMAGQPLTLAAEQAYLTEQTGK